MLDFEKAYMIVLIEIFCKVHWLVLVSLKNG